MRQSMNAGTRDVTALSRKSTETVTLHVKPSGVQNLRPWVGVGHVTGGFSFFSMTFDAER